ncbi:MAG: malto-oligosyltrehalose synthase, partial [Betaproteobacteria bacterium]
LPLSAIPRATYRVQLHRDFPFAALTRLVPYLAGLGISHVYCSPYLRARPGSRHGYDIVDHRLLNPEIGTVEDFGHLIETLTQHGMSHLCDVVPNHMAVMGKDNSWWMDVLENGPSSAYADYFDIDWAPHDPDLAGKVLVPVLGDPYGKALECGELRVAFEPDAGTFAVSYFEHRFPIDPNEYGRLMAPVLAQARKTLTARVAAKAKRLAEGFGALPSRNDADVRRIAQRRRDAAEFKRRLAELVRSDPPLAKAIDGALSALNEGAADDAGRDRLHALLEAQTYRLAFWRVASDEINYRRFFDINELAGLRMQNDAVFDATHELILGLAADGAIGGLRIDHPDGLYDPARYFARLQQRYRELASLRRPGAKEPPHGIFVALEKILAPHERLPDTWPVHGTTGYRFANAVNALLVDRRAKGRVDRAWRAFAGDDADTLDRDAYRGKRATMERALASELALLTRRALRLARADRRTRDFTFNTLRVAIREIVAHFPVYRTYVDEHGTSAQDRRYVDWAVARARARSRSSDSQVFDFLHDAFLGKAPAERNDAKSAYLEFAMRAQQFTAPVAAKGVEDTALYTFNRLVSLNEVGGDPEQFGLSVAAFHRLNADRASLWPHAMITTSTHDNKRSEDVRARIDVVSEMAAEWRRAAERWQRLNRNRVHATDTGPAPSRNDEYLLYQTLVGSFPMEPLDAEALSAYCERIVAYMVKATREAKVHTSWLAVNEAYEAGTSAFVRELLSGSPENRFIEDLRSQAVRYAWFGQLNSVSMTLLKLAVPGIPDFYQGTELFDGSLVDPDNRRPVDYARRGAQLATFAAIPPEVPPMFLRSLFAAPYDGRAKLWIIARALALRREAPALFAHGAYKPLPVSGTHAEHIVAFAREHNGGGVICVAGRLFASLGTEIDEVPLGGMWNDTTVDLGFLSPGTPCVDVLTGAPFLGAGSKAVSLSLLFTDFPGALVRYGAGPVSSSKAKS